MRSQKGISLLEILIAIVLGMLLILGVTRVFISSKYVFSAQTALSSIQETGRLAIEFISRDIRMAGFYGCQNSRIQTNNLFSSNINDAATTDTLHKNFSEFIRGYPAPANLPANHRLPINGVATVASNNILVIKRAGDSVFPLSEGSEQNSLKAYVDKNLAIANNCINGLCVNDIAIASNCSKGQFFKVDSLALTAGSEISTLMITHSGDWGDATNTLTYFSYGDIYPIDTITYFLSEGTSGQPSLWQKSSTGDAVEILEGVEALSFAYLIEGATDYVEASTVAAANWIKVKGVKVELVVRSLENNLVEEPQVYTFKGQTVTPTDRRQRQVFSTVVGVRGGLK